MKYVLLIRIGWRKGDVPRPLRIIMENPFDKLRLVFRTTDLKNKIRMEKFV